MIADLARAGGVAGALGLSVLLLAPARSWRLGGLAVWAAGCGAMALWLAPSGHHRAYAAAAVVGVAAAAGLAWLILRVPWTLAVAVLACVPARIPVSVGSTKANLLLPLYVVVAGAAAALGWRLARGDERSRELGPLALPTALFVAWSGIALLWSESVRDGEVYLLFYLLPLGLLGVSLARLPWQIGWVKALYALLAGMAFVFALIGVDQYLNREIYWNPKLKVDDAYTSASWFYRVNSVFYDPSIYGRFLVVAILASLALVLFEKSGYAWAALVAATVMLVGLIPSFSQSSLVALAVGIAAGLTVLWRRRAIVPLAVAAAALVAVTIGVPQLRHRVIGKQGISHASGGRSKLVTGGLKLAVHHPLIGVGTGGFVEAYHKQQHAAKKDSASHDAPITVAAELGVPGLALLVWLLAVALALPFRGNRGTTATERARLAFGLALTAIVVHSLFYDALFEDPLFWALLALSVVALRAGQSEPAA
jgi:O-antigen ligase